MKRKIGFTFLILCFLSSYFLPQHLHAKAVKKTPKRVVYLTFDDGPNSSVERILSILDKYHAKATFFMLNNNMKLHKKSVKKMVNKGHGIAILNFSMINKKPQYRTVVLKNLVRHYSINFRRL